MQHIIKTALQQTFNYKTNKSIYNILVGKKSHQTFFDACSQQQLSLYHSLPLLKYPSFELFLENITEFNAEMEIICILDIHLKVWGKHFKQFNY